MATVLLVDDEEALRSLMSRQLRRAGHEVTMAEDGLVAVGLLERQVFDVVVSDVKMPRLDGMGLLARAAEIAPETEFVILTGHGSLENAVEAFKLGRVFDYLLKPLEDIRELDAVVGRAAERRHLRSENGRLVSELEERVRDLEMAKRQLADLAQRDGLTGLFNHRTIHLHLEELMGESRNARVAIMAIDMDGFKLINDTYGHPVGDHVLRHLAKTLRESCGPDAVLGRCGGDEFTVIFPGWLAEQAAECAETIRQRLAVEPFVSPDGSRLPLKLCFGIADASSPGASGASLIASADSALYEGKHHGGDKITLRMSTEPANGDSQKTTYDVLDSLVTAIDNKDHYTRQHSEDVTQYALLLAEALGYSGETHNAIRVAGLLHDVGKIGVPDAVLRKPGKLTEDEYTIMKSHVTLSALIIHGLPRLPDILDAVAHHHERWDGKGYPRGLSGEEIPLLGRIMAIADAFSAMTLSRPYRIALPFDQALAEIENGIGTQFDPNLATVFIEEMRSRHSSERRAA